MNLMSLEKNCSSTGMHGAEKFQESKGYCGYVFEIQRNVVADGSDRNNPRCEQLQLKSYS